MDSIFLEVLINNLDLFEKKMFLKKMNFRARLYKV